jgi:hypothetical protein
MVRKKHGCARPNTTRSNRHVSQGSSPAKPSGTQDSSQIDADRHPEDHHLGASWNPRAATLFARLAGPHVAGQLHGRLVIEEKQPSATTACRPQNRRYVPPETLLRGTAQIVPIQPYDLDLGIAPTGAQRVVCGFTKARHRLHDGSLSEQLSPRPPRPRRPTPQSYHTRPMQRHRRSSASPPSLTDGVPPT